MSNKLCLPLNKRVSWFRLIQMATQGKTEAEERRIQRGRELFATRLCRQGRINKAKEYCQKMGLVWPPFGSNIAPELAPEKHFASGTALPTTPDEGVAVGAGPAAPDASTPTASVDVTAHAGQGDPAQEGAHTLVETRRDASAVVRKRPGVIRATVRGYCVNTKLIDIDLENGERASLWKDRRNYQLGDVLEVVVERGTPGLNAIYEEVKQ